MSSQRKPVCRRWVVAAGLSALLAVWCAASRADTWKLEVETAGEGDITKVVPGISSGVVRLKVMKAADASGGEYLGGSFTGETHPVATRIPHAGAYRVWVRHYRTLGKATSFFMVFRDDQKEGAGLRYFDFHNRDKNISALPDVLPDAPKDAKPAWVWTPCDYVFERPMAATVSFGNGGGLTNGTLGIDCVVITDDAAFDPTKADWAALAAEPGPAQAVKTPRGMTPVPAFTLHSSFFAGASNRDDQIKLCMVHGYLLYRDYPLMLQLGFNRDRAWNAGSVEYGIQTQVTPHIGYMAKDLEKKYPSPEGRRVNSLGKANDKRFSNSFAPYRETIAKEEAENVKVFENMDEVERYCVVGESGGVFDYSTYNRDRFHKWLEERFGTIARLNELWRTKYAAFSEIPLPKAPAPEENKASWFAFREFSGIVEVTAIAETVRTVNANDKKGRPCTSQGSCLHINSPWFTSTGSIDFEDMINIGFAESPMFGYDAYSTEDYFVGCDLEFLMSLAGKREVLNGEGNTHAMDPRIAARSYWCMLGKGVKGIDTWQLQDHPLNWVYSMWGMQNPDMTPRDKLAAISDANHEVHRIERIIRHANRQRFVKPVALYYSRMDLSLSQPVFDVYGAAIDSPYRVYSVLRGLGYPVRWITPKQIMAGDLKNVGAVALVGVKYVPCEAAQKIADWVKDGGAIIGDQWPGAFDEYDRMQGTLAQVFGVRADEAKPAKTMTPEEAKRALEEAATPVYGVDPNVLNALTADQFFKNVREMFNQRDSMHPISKAVGPWHLSGYDGKHVRVLSGEIIGQMMGHPGLVVNDYGKGHALYSAIMLGTLYEAGPVRFEWDSSREGPGFGNILDAFLRYSGLTPFSEAQLPLGVARKLRVECPLVDAKGNVFVGVISINDGPVQSFPLTMRWPEGAPVPRIVLVAPGGSRRIVKAPFEVKDGLLKVTMPEFDTHASILALTDSEPLVALEVTGAPRKVAGLLEVTPNTRLAVKATVWNPSPRKVAGGKVSLYGPAGWFSGDAEDTVWSIAPYESRSASFEVAAPAVCAARNLRPIVVKFSNAEVASTPATELVWWVPATEAKTLAEK